MTIHATSLGSALTPPRDDKHHRVTPNHHQQDKDKGRYLQAAMTGVGGEAGQAVAVSTAKKNNKRPHHQQQEQATAHGEKVKRQNVNPTPSKFKRSPESGVPSGGGFSLNNSGATSHQEAQQGLLDASQPEDLNKIQKRIKMLQKGKNTAGYERYRSLVPLSQRKKRSLEHPTTPNPYLKISSRRWSGLVKSWRIGLHKWDPPELVQSLQQPPQIKSQEEEEEDEEKPQNLSSASLSPLSTEMECQTPEPPKSKTAAKPQAQREAKKEFTPMETSPDASITIRDSDRADDDVSPCMSVVSSKSSTTPNHDKAKKHLNFGDAASPASTSGIVAKMNRFDEGAGTKESEEEKPSTPSSKKEVPKPASMPPPERKSSLTDKTPNAAETKKAPAAKRPLLKTGAKGWGDDSSDDDDDLL